MYRLSSVERRAYRGCAGLGKMLRAASPEFRHRTVTYTSCGAKYFAVLLRSRTGIGPPCLSPRACRHGLPTNAAAYTRYHLQQAYAVDPPDLRGRSPRPEGRNSKHAPLRRAMILQPGRGTLDRGIRQPPSCGVVCTAGRKRYTPG
jgi:hypothetical protein